MIYNVPLRTPSILTSLLARLVIADLQWFIPAIHTPQGTDAEVIHPWKNLSYCPFFQSCPCGNREKEVLSLEYPAQRSASLDQSIMGNLALGRGPKDNVEEKAEVLKPFLALICPGTMRSQTSVCTSTTWPGKGQPAVVEQELDTCK